MHWKATVLQSIFKKFAALKACNFIRKEIASQVLFCLHRKIFENDTAILTPPVAASDI